MPGAVAVEALVVLLFALFCFCCQERRLYAGHVGYDPRYKGDNEVYLCMGFRFCDGAWTHWNGVLAVGLHCAVNITVLVLGADTPPEPKLISFLGTQAAAAQVLKQTYLQARR